LKFKAEGFRSQTAEDFNIPPYLKIIGLGNVRKMKTIKNIYNFNKTVIKKSKSSFFLLSQIGRREFAL
jgi:hypothetical protein